jgi:Holliday junction resolvase RusA-like endonuclease
MPWLICEYYAPGKPVSKGSKVPIRTKSGKMLALEDPSRREKVKAWASTHTLLAAEQMGGRAPVDEHPLHVSLRFSFLRPKSHLKKNGELRKGAPVAMTRKPDIDKLVRPVLDALTGIVWRDDSQVTSHYADKSYGPQNGVWVKVECKG